MEDLLVKAGLSAPQARLYLHLLDKGEQTPPEAAKATGLTRTNAYKALERLEELGLVLKSESSKKISYQAADPAALASIVWEERNRALVLEQRVNEAMQQLRARYRTGNKKQRVVTGRGRQALIEAFTQHASRKQPVYFVKSRVDVPHLGYEAMDRIRRLPAKYGVQRFGITHDSSDGPRNPVVDTRSNLQRTLIAPERYTAPVEWTVSGDELLIVVFEDDGYYVRLQNPTVAEAFRQLWHLADTALRADPAYNKLGSKARRDI